MCVAADWSNNYPLKVDRREKERVSQFDNFYIGIVCRAMRNAEAEQEKKAA